MHASSPEALRMNTESSKEEPTFLIPMADGELESIWPHFLHAKRTPSPVELQTFSEGYTFLLLYCTGVFLCICGEYSLD